MEITIMRFALYALAAILVLLVLWSSRAAPDGMSGGQPAPPMSAVAGPVDLVAPPAVTARHVHWAEPLAYYQPATV